MIGFLKRTNMHRSLPLFNLHRRIAHFSFSSLPKISATNNSSYASGMRFDYTPEAITLLADDLITREKAMLDSIGNLDTSKDEDIGIETVLYPMVKCDQELSGISNVVTFLNNVHPDSDVRNASTTAETKLRKFGVDCGMREDVYKVLKALKEKINKNDGKCGDVLKQFEYSEEIVDKDGNKVNVTRNEWARYLDKTLQDFERNGLDLQDEAKVELSFRFNFLFFLFSRVVLTRKDVCVDCFFVCVFCCIFWKFQLFCFCVLFYFVLVLFLFFFFLLLVFLFCF